MKLLSCKAAITRAQSISLSVGYCWVQFEPSCVTVEPVILDETAVVCLCWGQPREESTQIASGTFVAQAFSSHCQLQLVWWSTTSSSSSLQAEEVCWLCYLSCPMHIPLRVEGTICNPLVDVCCAGAMLNMDQWKKLCLWGFSDGHFFPHAQNCRCKSQMRGTSKIS